VLNINRLLVSALLISVLTGCSIKYKAVGKFVNHNEVFVGDIDHDMIAGQADIVLRGENSGLFCRGQSYVTYIPPFALGCSGQRGKADLSCEDGRTAELDWLAKSCTTGYGRGKDSEGNKFVFSFGENEQEARNYVTKTLPEVASKPDLPIYKPKEVRKEKGFNVGTGFFVSKSGYFVTNHHVVEDAKEVRLTLKNGTKLLAEMIATDPANDVAIGKVASTDSWLTLDGDEILKKGDEVIALGYPLIAIQGQSQKATFGRVNALSGIKDDVRFLQVDVPIQPGNSGGPLLNSKGRVIGVITATLNQIITLRTSGALPQNVNYAVKVDYVSPLLKQYVQLTVPDSKKELSDHKMSTIVEQSEDAVFLIIAK
jgi:S1-C subfamily serine protease